jgi:hypothetical protein
MPSTFRSSRWWLTFALPADRRDANHKEMNFAFACVCPCLHQDSHPSCLRITRIIAIAAKIFLSISTGNSLSVAVKGYICYPSVGDEPGVRHLNVERCCSVANSPSMNTTTIFDLNASIFNNEIHSRQQVCYHW